MAYSVDAMLTADGGDGGVQFEDLTSLESQDAYFMAAVGLGGVAAEYVTFGDCRGGAADFRDVGRLVKMRVGGKGDFEAVVRWGLLVAVGLIRANRTALLELSKAMLNGCSTEQCISVIDRLVVRHASILPP